MKGKCQVCGTILSPEGEGVRICPTCRAASHEECWNHLGGCLSPECRKALREATRESASGLSERRQEALLRRRLGWIMAQRIGLAPEWHPEEVRLRVGAVVCALLAATTAAYGVAALAKIFAGCTALVLLLLVNHRKERRSGRLHRWIPAEAAPEPGLRVADWVRVLADAGRLGIPLEDFGLEYFRDVDDRRLLEECDRSGLVEITADEGDRVVRLTLAGAEALEEARSRAPPSYDA